MIAACVWRCGQAGGVYDCGVWVSRQGVFNLENPAQCYVLIFIVFCTTMEF